MAVRKGASAEDVNILSKGWSEIRKINWHEINRLTQQNFYIGLVGSPEQTAAMREWLMSSPDLSMTLGRQGSTQLDERELNKHLIEILPEQCEADEKLVKSTIFCLTPTELANSIRRHKIDCYLFDSAGANELLPPQILSNHIELRYALSHNFPVFRPKHASREINNTAFQNAAWAVLSGVPSTIPGPARLISAPFEGISDFAVMTLNEIKLMFELIGISGYRVVPIKRFFEISFILGMATLAETLATNLLVRIPAGGALAAKGAVAYAFTWAIGEGIYYYINTGKPLNSQTLTRSFKSHLAAGKRASSRILQNV
jgi:uncharacterized protein (DUF697 family)